LINGLSFASYGLIRDKHFLGEHDSSFWKFDSIRFNYIYYNTISIECQ